MFTVQILKAYWADAVLSVAYLIHRMPLEAHDFRTPLEHLQGTSSYVVPPKVFGCKCFIHNHRPTLS